MSGREIITDLASFKRFISADAKSRHKKLSFGNLLKDDILRFHLYLRLCELTNNKPGMKFIHGLVKWRFIRLSTLLGFSIPQYTLGPGVYLPHYGTIVVNSKSYVGAGTVVNVGVVIGRHPTSKLKVPVIGERVYLAPGVKIFGDVTIGRCCVIGANAVVTRSVTECSLVLGIPGIRTKELDASELTQYGMDS